MEVNSKIEEGAQQNGGESGDEDDLEKTEKELKRQLGLNSRMKEETQRKIARSLEALTMREQNYGRHEDEDGGGRSKCR